MLLFGVWGHTQNFSALGRGEVLEFPCCIIESKQVRCPPSHPINNVKTQKITTQCFINMRRPIIVEHLAN